VRAAGAQADFAELVREHQAMVYSIAWSSLQDRSTAEEVAQEVFLELYRRMDELESPEHIKHWLRRVTTNRCIDQSRRRKLRPKLGLDDIPEPVAASRGGDPLLSHTLQRLVAGLPEKWRMMVILRYQEDLDPADIAEIMGIPLGTVKSQLHRALAILREKLTRWKGGAI
jgi:RNA polymerase sigma-70 factor (ECF subfamily)